ncbi:hypothetical protein DDZ14_04700 [Maritimibacter sp. 55A14]|uniref:LPS assembly lipoprotein LptE n=1 Tax=Maritimibacter sp. 55A14 TaxID=2174844 RepID=UPI000D603E07|nr:LPS assembly lipoprotein LptE [Maritimibacter sp. 55A14]PWE33499.1 hypothetical protein DDZ14_04700 [Maritimibacter sp. 55A14]
MSSSDRRTFLTALALLPLAGCGFEPAFAPSGAAHGLQGQILVAPATNRTGFVLVGRLEDRLGRSGAGARYELKVSMRTRKEAIGITTANEIERFNVIGEADFVLREMAGGTVVQSGQVQNFTSYSATASTVSTLTAERDALERLAAALADQIVTRLLAGAAGRGS